MEVQKLIDDFLKIEKRYGDGDGYGFGSGDGYGDGSGSGDGSDFGYGYGYGSGSGYGDGSGSGDGFGSGDGSDFGSGYGDGDGDGIEKINGDTVYKIDSIQTLIDNVHGNYAKGRILNRDLTTTECFIAKCGNYFAHGKTLPKARSDAQEKYEEYSPLEERIKSFNQNFPSDTELISGKELFSWHHILTGSCLFGRQNFCKDHGLDIDSKYTVKRFIELTENAYGSDVIRKLKGSRKELF